MKMAPIAPSMLRIVVPFAVKAETVDKDARTFEGLAAVWDLDLGGDVIHKGAFKQTLKDWKKSNEALPLLNSHDHWDIMSALGQLIEGEETERGLWTKWEVIDGPDGDAVLARLRPSKRTKRAVVGKMSIGYDPVKFDFEQNEGAGPFDRIRHLREIKLRESSLVLFPMAPGASVDASTVKTFLQQTMEMDPGRISDDVRTDLRRLNSRIGKLLSGKNSGARPSADPSPSPATGEPPDTAPSEEQEQQEQEQEQQDPTPPPAPAPPAATGAEDGGTEGEETKVSAQPLYLYGEALQQRLQRTLLKSRISEVTTQ